MFGETWRPLRIFWSTIGIGHFLPRSLFIGRFHKNISDRDEISAELMGNEKRIWIFGEKGQII